MSKLNTTGDMFHSGLNELEVFAEHILSSLGQKKELKKRGIEILTEFKPIEVAYKSALCLQGGISGHKPLVAVAGSIGQTILLGKEDHNESERTIRVRRIRIGLHIIKILFDKGILKPDKGENKRDPYYLKPQKSKIEWIDRLFRVVNTEPLDIPVNIRPSRTRPKPFESFHHDVAGQLVRKTNRDAIPYFTKDNCPKVYETINKHMDISYVVNTDVLDVYDQCQDDPIFTLSNKDINSQQKDGMQREMINTMDIARGMGKSRFWEYMFFDSRGRLYSSSVYFTHQGSKLSKSLFKYANKKRLGREGWFWLLFQAANCYGWDKLPIEERYDKAEASLKEWMRIAEDPVNNKAWQHKDVDDKFGFLASILEIKKALEYEKKKGSKYNYTTGFMVYEDATCSGLQILTLLGSDEKSAKLCNLANTGVRGDFYGELRDFIAPKLKSPTEPFKIALDDISAEIRPLQDKIEDLTIKYRDAEGQSKHFLKERLTIAKNTLKKYFRENEEQLSELAPYFWGQEHLKSKLRSVCKRPGMTRFYSCGAKTMAYQLYNDWSTEPDFRGINPVYCQWLADHLYEACDTVTRIPIKIMNLLIEVGLKSYDVNYREKCELRKNGNDPKRLEALSSESRTNQDFFTYGPFNKFLMYHNYRNHLTERVKINYRKNVLQLQMITEVGKKVNIHKVKSATSPNYIHMLDGQIVSSVILNAKGYKVSTIHDSFATHAVDAGKLYHDVRVNQYNIFKDDLLKDLLEEKGFTDFEETDEYEGSENYKSHFCFKPGTLDKKLQLDDEYTFS